MTPYGSLTRASTVAFHAAPMFTVCSEPESSTTSPRLRAHVRLEFHSKPLARRTGVAPSSTSHPLFWISPALIATEVNPDAGETVRLRIWLRVDFW